MKFGKENRSFLLSDRLGSFIGLFILMTLVAGGATGQNYPPVIDCGEFENMGVAGEVFTKSDIIASDANPEDPLTFSIIYGPGTIESATGLYHWTTTENDIGVHTVEVEVSDGYAFDSCEFIIEITPLEISCGDANSDGALNVGDAVFLINYVFKGGPAPVTLAAGDPNCDGAINVGDAVYMINFVFKGGQDPCTSCPGACCGLDCACSEMTASECFDAGGAYLGDRTHCIDYDCESFPADPVVVFPEDSSSWCDRGLLVAEDRFEWADYSGVDSVFFEYSVNSGASWIQITEVGHMEDWKAMSPNLWTAELDVDLLPSGECWVRVVMVSVCGQYSTSPITTILINRPPEAGASAGTAGSVPGQVLFDGNWSWDTDGSIVNWYWEFGDGGVDTGNYVAHIFDLEDTTAVTLIVEDDQGCQSAVYYSMWFPSPEMVLLSATPQQFCKCKNLYLRGDNLPGEADVLGRDGVPAGTDWKKWPNKCEGKKNGKGNDDPENEETDNEKRWTFYAFEVVCDVDGIPALCKEAQFAKGAVVLKGKTKRFCNNVKGKWNAAAKTCTFTRTWTGTGIDTDLDGVNDYDVSTKIKCEAKGGTWNVATNNCTVEFPQSGADYNLDNYTTTSTYKTHPDKKIIWYDVPGMIRGGIGSTMKGDFKAVIRDTDGTVHTITFSIDLERKTGADKENISSP